MRLLTGRTQSNFLSLLAGGISGTQVNTSSDVSVIIRSVVKIPVFAMPLGQELKK